MKRYLFHLFAILLLAQLAACKPSSTPPGAANHPLKPTPPLQLAEPERQPNQHGNLDLSQLSPSVLEAEARAAMEDQDYAEAQIYQYWLVQKTHEGQYNLACCFARTNNVDAAFYWLQVAALEEGVDADHANKDVDLTSLRKDARWKVVFQFLQDCTAYFKTVVSDRIAVITPHGYNKDEPIPTIVWLHGFGSKPDDLVSDAVQPFADELHVAFIGVSGTQCLGPTRFAWSQNADQDGQRVERALAQAADRITIKKGDLIFLGFSQGAQMGLEIALRNPDRFRGAIALSPGAAFHLTSVTPPPSFARHFYVVGVGQKEMPGNVDLATRDVTWIKRNGGNAEFYEYPGVSAHAFPRDFSTRFPRWVTSILNSQ